MAELLSHHWGQIFRDRPRVDALLREWLAAENANLPCPLGSPRWNLERHHLEQSLKLCSESAPGPDGIPYLAWKVLKDISVPVLYEAALALQVVEPDALPPGFNHAFLRCLPKKPSGEHPDVGTYYAPSATMPLSLSTLRID